MAERFPIKPGMTDICLAMKRAGFGLMGRLECAVGLFVCCLSALYRPLWWAAAGSPRLGRICCGGCVGGSDQGRQFTCQEWKETCAEHPEMRISMDGRGRAKDNIWIERFWRTIRYDYIYIQQEENGAALYQGILRFIDDYNYHRHHQGIDRQIPSRLYLWSAA